MCRNKQVAVLCPYSRNLPATLPLIEEDVEVGLFCWLRSICPQGDGAACVACAAEFLVSFLLSIRDLSAEAILNTA